MLKDTVEHPKPNKNIVVSYKNQDDVQPTTRNASDVTEPTILNGLQNHEKKKTKRHYETEA